MLCAFLFTVVAITISVMMWQLHTMTPTRDQRRVDIEQMLAKANIVHMPIYKMNLWSWSRGWLRNDLHQLELNPTLAQ